MNDLTPFTNGEFSLIVEMHEADGFRVQAPLLARALGFASGKDMLRSIPDGEKGWEVAPTPGGDQRIGYVTEAGFYRALGQRQAARITDARIRGAVERFQSWVYADVLPTIRKTGRYEGAAQVVLPKSYAEALRELAATVEERDTAQAKVAELEPAAEAWGDLVDTGTTLDVAAAAKKLVENGIVIGRTRLYAYMREIGWVFKHSTQPMQSAVDTGWLVVDWGKQYTNAKTGEEGQGEAKSRVTAKGLAELRRRLSIPQIA